MDLYKDDCDKTDLHHSPSLGHISILSLDTFYRSCQDNIHHVHTPIGSDIVSVSWCFSIYTDDLDKLFSDLHNLHHSNIPMLSSLVSLLLLRLHRCDHGSVPPWNNPNFQNTDLC